MDETLPKDIKLDFVLIDVEQMELEALYGMKEIVKRSPDLIILTEWQEWGKANKEREFGLKVVNFFLDLKYKVYQLQGPKQFCVFPGLRRLWTAEEIDIKAFTNIALIPGHIEVP